jgi:hypothetical protein
MNYIVVDGVALSRQLGRTFGDPSFARWSTEQGYSFCSLHRQVLVAACFSQWLGQNARRIAAFLCSTQNGIFDIVAVQAIGCLRS